MIKIKDLKTDCRFFKGDIPCLPSKLHGVYCNNCNFYKQTKEKILIIKLGAAGDVIRTTPLLYPLKKLYPDSFIYWLTYYPDLIPQYNKDHDNVIADKICEFSLQNVLYLKEIDFDLLINLDKDNEAISLTNSISAKEKLGYTIKNGLCYPLTNGSSSKYLTGLFDDASKRNTKSYLSEIFEVCGFKFNKEKYILNIDDTFSIDWDINKNNTVVGLNTGCGSRWTSRLWKDEYWIELINILTANNYEVILLGGEQEDNKNKFYKQHTQAKYFGCYNLKTFINLVNKCDVIVTQVTMALHIAIGLQKKVILLNNIFNKNEFELYDKGVIIEPNKVCKCYYSPICTNEKYKCMDYLLPKTVFSNIENLIK